MLPESLRSVETAVALDAQDAAAVTGGELNLGEALLWIRSEKIVEACRFLRDQRGFERVSGVTVVDRHPVEPRFEVVYLLHSVSRNERLKLKVALPGESADLDSVTSVWPGADWYEREAFDLFGVRFVGHPDLKRIMLPEEWEGHPLRKDFPVHGHKYSYRDE
ncbi:MAG TPA: NADH-quinone oxidoreductase subunit C [Bryobacteraceae bacterium]|nr:NADH-quinone oxidoreductase subunit C [Bryobacteraceae bacterium]